MLYQVIFDLVGLHADVTVLLNQALVPLLCQLLLEVDLWRLLHRGQNLRLPVERFKPGIVQLGQVRRPVRLQVHLELGQLRFGGARLVRARWQELDAVFVAPEVSIAHQVVLLGRELDSVAKVRVSLGSRSVVREGL